jgi:hypothetical protein
MRLVAKAGALTAVPALSFSLMHAREQRAFADSMHEHLVQLAAADAAIAARAAIIADRAAEIEELQAALRASSRQQASAPVATPSQATGTRLNAALQSCAVC